MNNKKNAHKISDRDILEGPILKTLFKLAWPNIIAFTLHTMYNLVDAIYVGRISSEAIAAVTMSFPVFFFMFAIGSGLGVGVNSTVSKYLGSNKKNTANKVAMNGYFIAAILGTIFSVFGLLFSKNIFSMIGATGNILSMATAYSKWIFVGTFFMIVSMISTNIIRGNGNSKTPMKAIIISVLINSILDPILIFGLFSFPKLGVEGAAIATMISRFISFLYTLTFVLRGKTNVKIKFSEFKIDFSLIKEMFKISIPASLSQMLSSFALIILTKIASLINEIAIATIGIVLRIDSTIVMPAIAISIAVVTFVGHNYGANKLKRSKKIAKYSTMLTFVILEMLGILSFIFSKEVASIFTSNLDLIKNVSLYLKIEGLFYGLVAISIILPSSLQGFGYGLPVFVFSFIRLFLIVIPFAYYFSIVKALGIVGIWYSFPIGTVVNAGVAFLWFKIFTKKLKIKN